MADTSKTLLFGSDGIGRSPGIAIEFATNILTASNFDECRDLFSKAIAPYGLTVFTCGEIDFDDRGRTVIYLHNWPEDWRRFYLSSGLVNRDPVIEAARIYRAPVLWSQLKRDDRVSCAGHKTLEVFAENGWREGFLVPFQRSETRYGLVSAFGPGPFIAQDDVKALVMMSVSLIERARRLVPQQGVFVQFAGLTTRELDTLRLLAQGLSDKRIAAKLSISPSTAHEYVESAKSKLGVTSRSSAAVIATSLGLA